MLYMFIEFREKHGRSIILDIQVCPKNRISLQSYSGDAIETTNPTPTYNPWIISKRDWWVGKDPRVDKTKVPQMKKPISVKSSLVL